MKDMTHQFLDWLRSKPADEEYDYCDNGNCAISQFLRENGYSADPYVFVDAWTGGELGVYHPIPSAMNRAVHDGTSANDRYSFGFALNRLEKLLGK